MRALLKRILSSKKTNIKELIDKENNTKTSQHNWFPKEKLPQVIPPFIYIGDLFMRSGSTKCIYQLILTQNKVFKIKNINTNTLWKAYVEPTNKSETDAKKFFLDSKDFKKLLFKNRKSNEDIKIITDFHLRIIYRNMFR